MALVRFGNRWGRCAGGGGGRIRGGGILASMLDLGELTDPPLSESSSELSSTLAPITSPSRATMLGVLGVRGLAISTETSEK